MGNKPAHRSEPGQIYEGVLNDRKGGLEPYAGNPGLFHRLAKLEAELDAYQARSR